MGFSGVGLHRGRVVPERHGAAEVLFTMFNRGFFIGITPWAVHRKPRAVPLGFVVLAFQAGWWGVRDDEMSSNLSCAGRETGLDHGEREFSPIVPRDRAGDWWRYPLRLSAFPYGFEAFRPAVGPGSRQQAKGDCFQGNRLILSHFVSSTST